jgi:UDP-2,4-diacetamido-2,4,6-trideoxy-beta-L-altropyranose hydrolase
MKILIRVDSSILIGSGHVMRCLTLANQLDKKDFTIEFVCRKLPGNLIDHINKHGYKVYCLNNDESKNEKKEDNSLYPLWENTFLYEDALDTSAIIKDKDIDLLITDHYRIDEKWEKIVRPLVKKIMVIDDLADRNHDCDFLLDQNFYKDLTKRYKNRISENCKMFLGPKYALLRDEFYHIIPKRSNRLMNRILIFFGGTDPSNQTEKAIKAFINLGNYEIEADVIIGATNNHVEHIKELCEKNQNIHLHIQVENISEYMSKSDLAIGAGGTTVYERSFLGLPSIVISIAKNQEEIARDLHEEGYIYYLGKDVEISQEEISIVLKEYIHNDKLRDKLSEKTIELVQNNKKYVNHLIQEVFFEDGFDVCIKKS